MLRAQRFGATTGVAILAALLSAVAAAAGGETAPPAGGAYRGLILEMTGDGDAPVRVWNAEGKPVLDPYYAFQKKGLALLGREYALRLEGGCFYSGGADDYLGADLKNADGELTLAAYVCPAAAGLDKPGLAVGYGPARGDALFFALTQEKDALVFSIGAPKPSKVKLAELKSAEPFHLVLTVSRKEIVLYRNGEKAGAAAGTGGDFSAWDKGVLWIGNAQKGDLPWRGQIERLSLYNRALSAEEAKKVSATFLEEVRQREPVASIELTGTLLARSKYKLPWDKGFTYRDVLSVSEYKVAKVIRGEFKEAKIRVAEWMYVDRIFLAGSRKEVGKEYRLVVEQLDDNAYLSTTETGNTLDQDLDAVVHYEIGSIEALPKDQQPKSDTDVK
jgi:hypothetical protein